MRDFRTIIEILKVHVADGRSDKVYDKDIATLLDISQAKFATIKKRNSIPYAEILKFCKQEDLSCCDIFFD